MGVCCVYEGAFGWSCGGYDGPNQSPEFEPLLTEEACNALGPGEGCPWNFNTNSDCESRWEEDEDRCECCLHPSLRPLDCFGAGGGQDHWECNFMGGGCVLSPTGTYGSQESCELDCPGDEEEEEEEEEEGGCKYIGECIARLGDDWVTKWVCDGGRVVRGEWDSEAECKIECCKKCESCPAPKIADCEQCCDVDSLWEFVTSPTNSINGPTWEVLGGGGGMGGGVDPLTGLPTGGPMGLGGQMGGMGWYPGASAQEGGHRIKYTAKDSENCDGQGNKIQSGKATRMFHATEDFELTVKMLTNHESRKDHDIVTLKLYKVSPCCTGVCDIESISISVEPCGCECKQLNNNRWAAYDKTSTDGGACVAKDEPKTDWLRGLPTEYDSIEECYCASSGCNDRGYCSGACCAPGDDPTPCEIMTKNECEEKEWNYSGKDTSCMMREGESVCEYDRSGACCSRGWRRDGGNPVGVGEGYARGPGWAWSNSDYAPDGYPCSFSCDIKLKEECDDGDPYSKWNVWHGEGSSCVWFAARGWDLRSAVWVAKGDATTLTEAGYVGVDGNAHDCNLYPHLGPDFAGMDPGPECSVGDAVTGPAGSGVILYTKWDIWKPNWFDRLTMVNKVILIKSDSGVAWVPAPLVFKDGIPCECGGPDMWKPESEPGYVPTGACCVGSSAQCHNTADVAACNYFASRSQPDSAKWHGLGTICEENTTGETVYAWWDRDFNLHDCGPPQGGGEGME